MNETNDLKRANVMIRVLTDMRGEGNSVATMARRYSLSEESIRTVLGISPPEPEPEPKPPSRSIIARLRGKLGFQYVEQKAKLAGTRSS
jgi:lambda repressor-like predicted transcriptional regulator